MLSRLSQTIPRQVADTERAKSGAGLSRPRGTGCTQGRARLSSGEGPDAHAELWQLRGSTRASNNRGGRQGYEEGPMRTLSFLSQNGLLCFLQPRVSATGFGHVVQQCPANATKFSL